MNPDKKEQIKMYFLVGLTLVAGGVAYFRFFHTGQKALLSPPTQQQTLPTIKNPTMNQTLPSKTTMPPHFFHPAAFDTLKDIFSPPDTLFQKASPRQKKRGSTPKRVSKPVLKGVILGDKVQVAVINQSFVRVGEWIDGYHVILIDKERVVLERDQKRIELFSFPKIKKP